MLLQLASDRLKNDYEIVKNAVKNNGSALQFASELLKNNSDIVRIAIENSGIHAIQHAGEEIQKENFWNDYIDLGLKKDEEKYEQNKILANNQINNQLNIEQDIKKIDNILKNDKNF